MTRLVVTAQTTAHWTVCVDQHRVADIRKDPLGAFFLLDYEGELVGKCYNLKGATDLARMIYGEGIPV
jgi:hypothetical protein